MGPWSSNVASALCADVPDVVERAPRWARASREGACADSEACAALAAHSVRVDFRPPALAYPEGNNGAAVTLYEVQLSGRQPAVQTVTLTPVLGPEASLGSGSYRLESGNATTACVAVRRAGGDARAAPRGAALRGRRVRGEEQGPDDGRRELRRDLRRRLHVQQPRRRAVRPAGACAAPYDPAQVAVATSATSARPAFQPGAVPEVATIRTGARVYRKGGLEYRGPISGKFEVAWDFTGAPDLALWDPAPQKIVTASVRAGSTRVTVPVEYNLTGLLNPGDLVRLGDEVHRVAPGRPLPVRQRLQGPGADGPGRSFDIEDYHPSRLRRVRRVRRADAARLGLHVERVVVVRARARPGDVALQSGRQRPVPGTEEALYGSTGLAGVQRRGRNASAYRRQHVLVPHDASAREMRRPRVGSRASAPSR